MQIQRIVVGLAPGPRSDAAVLRAAELARLFGARVEVVHGAGVQAPHLGAARRLFFARHEEGALASARAAARSRVARLLAPFDLPPDDVLRVEPAPAPRAVLERARATSADLVVLGAHRRRRPLDVGRTARAVLARSPCPVWVEPEEPARIQRVLAPVDLSSSSALVLRAACELAARLVVPVRVLHVFVPPEFAYDPEQAPIGPTYVVDDLREEERAATHELVSSFDFGALTPEVDLEEGEPSEKIVERWGPSDLVVMGTHGHGAWARAVLGSCAQRVLEHARGAMLVVPLRAEHYAEH